ncbi:MAG: RNA methyltransferase [Chitinophagaceae bacterium]|nr:RNA methyltransferase [Chitinophagaceae bacterium]
MDELNRKSVEEFKQSQKKKIIVVLDNIRSMHNVGSVFRTSDAFLIEAICICGFTAQPPHRDINKTALGATETVSWIYFENTVDAITELKENNYTIYAVEQTEGSISLEEFPNSDQPIAVVFGNEVEGVSDEVLQQVDGCIEIPQLGMKHSLNISVAAGIVLWKLVWG